MDIAIQSYTSETELRLRLSVDDVIFGAIIFNYAELCEEDQATIDKIILAYGTGPTRLKRSCLLIRSLLEDGLSLRTNKKLIEEAMTYLKETVDIINLTTIKEEKE